MHVLWIYLLLFFTACGDKEPDTTEAIEVVFFNAEIYTVNENQPWAEAFLVEDGVIKFVGTDGEVKNEASSNAEMIDMEGLLIIPGIHDVHLHPLEAASNNFQFILDDQVEDAEEYATNLETALAENPGTGWLLGWGFDLEILLEATRNPKEILDELSPDRPVGIMELTSHSIWANSKALELMGISNDSENPIGGIIMRDELGEPNGLLMDNAGNILIDLALPVTAESKQNDYEGLIEFALPELAKHGITSLCDARTYWKRDHHETWKKIANEGNLTARVNLGLWAYPNEEDNDQLNVIKGLYENNPNSLLKINQIKLYSDGIVHNTTCAMHDNYMLDYFGEMTNNGLNYFTEERIAQYITELEPIGFDFHIHAIGNRGVHESLNAIEQGGSNNGRHRLTHVEYVDEQDMERFAELNVTADAQVAGDFTNPEHWHDFDFLIGAAVNNNVVPIKSLTEAGARVTLSSDWDVSELNPFIGMQNALTRNPQNIGLEQVIKAYTLNAAYVMRQEELVGSIQVGKEADFIVLDQNIFEIEPTQVAQTKVLETYLKGELIYER